MSPEAQNLDMDDGYALGPTEVVFPAVERFADRVRWLGLDLQVHRCRCFSPGIDLTLHPLRPTAMPVGSIMLPDGSEARGISQQSKF